MGLDVAAKLLNKMGWEVSSTPPRAPEGSGPAPKPMNRESQARFVAVLLFLLTVAAVIFAGFNFEKDRNASTPDDGVFWAERDGHLFADRVDPDKQGAKAGIKANDELVAINGEEVHNTSDQVRHLYA